MTDRPVSTALYLLRCVQIGLHMSDLEYLTMGAVFDLFAESANDDVEYNTVATQADFDKF